eukprot:Nitzschia sp. Nitz4//scaffold294_size23022//4824//5833//NITZ4_008513-RA/size23022-augustus-gene-0.19-mRNA-1//-1//CDS//3329546220//1555//frame0
MILGTLLTYLVFLISRVQGSAIELTLSNFAEAVEGKNVFIKFYAPWCGHCRNMEEDWDELAKEYNKNPITLVAQVDCTSDEGQPVCQDFDIQGFPTIVYGDPMSAETYEGPREYEAMSAFAKKHLTSPICNIFKIENCNDQDKKVIETLQAQSTAELEIVVQDIEKKVGSLEKVFDEKVAAIQKQYDQLVQDFNQNLDDLKKQYNFKFVEQIISVRREAGEGHRGDLTPDAGEL